jgi:hypothetical protein
MEQETSISLVAKLKKFNCEWKGKMMERERERERGAVEDPSHLFPSPCLCFCF